MIVLKQHPEFHRIFEMLLKSIGFLLNLKDDNVDVIYVSAISVTEETLQYYFKLLGLRTAIQTGNANDQKDISHRYKVVIPEALKSFPVYFIQSIISI